MMRLLLVLLFAYLGTTEDSPSCHTLKTLNIRMCASKKFTPVVLDTPDYTIEQGSDGFIKITFEDLLANLSLGVTSYYNTSWDYNTGSHLPNSIRTESMNITVGNKHVEDLSLFLKETTKKHHQKEQKYYSEALGLLFTSTTNDGIEHGVLQIRANESSTDFLHLASFDSQMLTSLETDPDKEENVEKISLRKKLISLVDDMKLRYDIITDNISFSQHMGYNINSPVLSYSSNDTIFDSLTELTAYITQSMTGMTGDFWRDPLIRSVSYEQLSSSYLPTVNFTETRTVRQPFHANVETYGVLRSQMFDLVSSRSERVTKKTLYTKDGQVLEFTMAMKYPAQTFSVLLPADGWSVTVIVNRTDDIEVSVVETDLFINQDKNLGRNLLDITIPQTLFGGPASGKEVEEQTRSFNVSNFDAERLKYLLMECAYTSAYKFADQHSSGNNTILTLFWEFFRLDEASGIDHRLIKLGTEWYEARRSFLTKIWNSLPYTEDYFSKIIEDLTEGFFKLIHFGRRGHL